MAKATAPPVSGSNPHAAFRARAQEALDEVTIYGRVVLVSDLLAPSDSGRPDSHGTSTGYTEYLCRCDECATAYTTYRKDRRESNMAHRENVDGVMVSTLLGTEGYPDHGVVTGTYWYGCDCEPCQAAKRDSRLGVTASGKKAADVRAENFTHLVPRSSDGVLVSTLLGTEGYPDHGTYSGADWFGCWCEECRGAKNTLARLGYVLRRNWPAQPERGELSTLARDILAVQSGNAKAEREQIGHMLRRFPVWADASMFAEAEAMADRLAVALAGKTEEAA